MKDNDTTKYADIIGLPHYEPKHHKRMPLYARAAQFAPFAALTGYEEAIAKALREKEQGGEGEGPAD